jgi:adenosylcobinamide-GDP ribazoletransferase
LIKDFLRAARFLTVLPLGEGEVAEPKDMARSMAWFPLVGLLMGALLWVADGVLLLVFPLPLVSVIDIALLALITGGLHLDGFADMMDGLFCGHGNREKILAIMKDSRVGAMGVIGLVLLLLLKASSLASIAGPGRAGALLLMPCLARWSQVHLSYNARIGRPEGSLAMPFIQNLGQAELFIAFAVAFASAGILSGARGLAAVLTVVVLTVCSRALCNEKIGGITGDIIGATNEANELLVLLVFAVHI